MKLTAPYSKVTELIRKKTGKYISLSMVSSETIRIGYDLIVNLPIIGERAKHFDIEATINGIVGSDVYISLNEGLTMLANGALSFINMNSLVERCDNGFVLHLNGIDSLRSVLNTVSVQNISFGYDVIELEFDVKI